jgi:hypothetical protein
MSRKTTDRIALKLIDLLTALISKLGPWVLAVLASCYIRASILAATQQQTAWAAWMRMMAGLNQVRAFAFIFGMVGLVYGIRERELRRAAVKRLRRRNTELECLLEQREEQRSCLESRR